MSCPASPECCVGHQGAGSCCRPPRPRSPLSVAILAAAGSRTGRGSKGAHLASSLFTAAPSTCYRAWQTGSAMSGTETESPVPGLPPDLRPWPRGQMTSWGCSPRASRQWACLSLLVESHPFPSPAHHQSPGLSLRPTKPSKRPLSPPFTGGETETQTGRGWPRTSLLVTCLSVHASTKGTLCASDERTGPSLEAAATVHLGTELSCSEWASREASKAPVSGTWWGAAWRGCTRLV